LLRKNDPAEKLMEGSGTSVWFTKAHAMREAMPMEPMVEFADNDTLGKKRLKAVNGARVARTIVEAGKPTRNPPFADQIFT
jgi:hypothetical protein